jgi:hypothetical protein
VLLCRPASKSGGSQYSRQCLVGVSTVAFVSIHHLLRRAHKSWGIHHLLRRARLVCLRKRLGISLTESWALRLQGTHVERSRSTLRSYHGLIQCRALVDYTDASLQRPTRSPRIRESAERAKAMHVDVSESCLVIGVCLPTLLLHPA